MPDLSPAALVNSQDELPRHLRDLNTEQYEAVRHTDGPLLIFAGAGSGKTRVLTRRVANLILSHDVDPQRILAVTFTNKAAREMKERLFSLLSGRRGPSWVSTFHAFCARLLRQHAALLHYTPTFAIYDTSDSVSTMKRVFERLKLDPRVVDPRRVLSRIDRAKNGYQFSDAVREDRSMPEEIANMMAMAFDEYQKELQLANAMDFGDLLCNVVTLFKLEPNVLRQYQEHFRYIMIDEYQDTNHVQYLLVKMLAEKNQNLCVVGDDDQSIYAFRGASVENILNFQRDFPDAKVVTLEVNYRSTKNVLDAANAIIKQNTRRQKKSMRTDNDGGAAIVCFHGHDEAEEAQFVVREVVGLLKAGTAPADIAIFYRTNAQSRAVEEVLCENGVPYEIYGGHRFYDRKEIKDLLAYFRLLINPADNEAFLRIVNVPARGLGASSIAALENFARIKKLPLYPALATVFAEGGAALPSAAKKKFELFFQILEELRKETEKSQARLARLESAGSEAIFATDDLDAIATLIKAIAERSRYLGELKKQDTLESQSRIENIFELFSVASEFVRRSVSAGDFPKLEHFLERTSLASDLDKSEEGAANTNKTPEPRGTVSLMTLHLAKGLEFETVFLTGLEEGLLPHVRSLDSRADLEEERRLCYVGITRARKQLFLSRALYRDSFGRWGYGAGGASRFLDELPKEILEHRGAARESF